jgi:hypothetical protein
LSPGFLHRLEFNRNDSSETQKKILFQCSTRTFSEISRAYQRSVEFMTHQIERVYGGHFCHLVREDGPEVRDVTGGEAQGVQLRQLRVSRNPGQSGLEATERFAQDTHTSALPRVRCVPLLRLLACAHPIFIITEVWARSSTGSTHCTTSSARHFLPDIYHCCTEPSNAITVYRIYGKYF